MALTSPDYCWQTASSSTPACHSTRSQCITGCPLGVRLFSSPSLGITGLHRWTPCISGNFHWGPHFKARSQWPNGLMRRSGAYRLLRLRVPNPPEAWMSVSYEWCMLSGGGLCHGPILRPKESYRLVCHCVRCRNLKNEAALAAAPEREREREIKLTICTTFCNIRNIYSLSTASTYVYCMDLKQH